MNVSAPPIVETEDTDVVAYALSHDLRARLRAATGFLELGRAEIPEDADVAYFLDRAASASKLADRMVARLVTYLRVQPAGEIVPTDPAMLIQEVIGRRTDGPATIVDMLPTVPADADLLAMAVAEVLDNAVRYRAEDRSPQVTVTGTVDGPWAVLRFADNGSGINADRVDRAFELFRQVHRVGESPGSGMGLPIARRCIENQGGVITLSPGVDSGTIVEIRLPAARGG